MCNKKEYQKDKADQSLEYVLRDILIPNYNTEDDDEQLNELQDVEHDLEKLEDELKEHKRKMRDMRSELDFAEHIKDEYEKEIKELKGE